MSARDDVRGLSELAIARTRDDGIALSWDAYNAKKKAAAGAKIPYGAKPPHSSVLTSAKPEDTTLSPDGSKLHVVVKNPATNQTEQHEFQKKDGGWLHHSGSNGQTSVGRTGVRDAIHTILSNKNYVSTHGEDIPLPKGK